MAPHPRRRGPPVRRAGAARQPDPLDEPRRTAAAQAVARVAAAPPSPAVLAELRARVAREYEIEGTDVELLSATTETVLVAQAQRLRQLDGRPPLPEPPDGAHRWPE